MQKSYTDVLILGSGAAGIRAAAAACEAGAQVMLVAQGKVTDRGSTFSNISRGWGIQALLAEERTDQNLELFFEEIAWRAQSQAGRDFS
jgi:succinate dehydrogenase/fumarate reductase flavoprotein subunit